MKATRLKALASLWVLAACGSADPSSESTEGQSAIAEREAAVAEAGAEVMPFDLERTTHIFEKLEDGGRQQVLADSDDPEQIRLIREHLGEEAERFAAGDFHDPEMIHGEEMPGLHALVVGHERLTIEYSEIERGAQILYSSGDPELVAAIHAWFDAQLRDHGDHARSHR